MKQKRSKRMQLVVDLAMAAETQAARNLSEAQKAVQTERQRHDDIQAYYQSYEAHFSHQTHNLRAEDLIHSRTFLSNLDQACQAQSVQVQNTERQAELAREQWRTSHLKADALESYRKGLVDTEQKVSDKKEQSVLDDLACQTRRTHR